MNRRGFFSTLFAGIAARFLPKPKFQSGIAIAHAYKEDGHLFYELAVANELKYACAVGTGYMRTDGWSTSPTLKDGDQFSIDGKEYIARVPK
jgi:hypothetical protein